MIKNLISTGFSFILIIGNIMAQEVFQGQSFTADPNTHKALGKWYKSYKIAEFDLDALNKKMIAEKGNSSIDLRFGEESWKLNLFKNELRSSNYKSFKTENKEQIELKNQPNITYAGYASNNPDNYVRLTISDEIFRGYIVVDGQSHYFIQLKHIIRNSNKNIIVIYQAKDQKENNSSSCGVTNEQEQAFLSRVQTSALAVRSGASTCRILELATDADFEWFQQYGSNSNNEILSIVNMIQGTYQNNFNLEIVVVFQNVFTTASDPYTANPLTNSGSLALVAEVRNYWEINFANIERDVVHLFSGKGNSVITGFRGRVYSIGSICVSRSDSYGFSRNWADQFETTAHEIGHHFGGVHSQAVLCSGPDGSLMCSSNNHSSLYFSTGSTNTIEAFMNTNSACLLEFDNINITGASTVCNNQTKSYSVNTVLNGNVTWSVNNSNLSIIGGQGTSIVTVRGKSSGGGETILTSTIPTNNCDVVVTKSIWVGNPGSVGTISGSNAVSQGQWVYYSVSSSIPNNGIYDWTLPTSGQPCLPPSTNCWYFLYGGDGLPYAQVSVGSSSGLVQVKRVNSCGSGPTSYKYVNVNSGGGGGGGCCITPAFVSPNPASNELSIQFKNESTNLQVAETDFGYEVEYTLTDFMGNIVFSKTSKKTKQKLNLSRVREEGIYVLTIKHGDKGSEQHRIVIDR